MIKKLLKNNFFMGTLILLTGGFLSKLLGFVLRIIITRQIGTEGIGLYSLITPTFGLFITIATFSYPASISKVINVRGKSSKSTVFSIIPISLLLNLITLLIIFLIAKPLAVYFLKDARLYIPLLSIGFTLPFIGLSSIIKGYYWGKQRMGVYILSNIVEQIVRITILIFLIPILIEKSLVLTISVIILVNMVSETSSIIVMLLGLPKGITLSKEDINLLEANLYAKIEDLKNKEKFDAFEYEFLTNLYLKDIIVGYFIINNKWLPKDKKLFKSLKDENIELFRLCKKVIETYEYKDLINVYKYIFI